MEAAFPIYRRTADDRHAYRIEAPDRFTEIQRVGSRLLVHEVCATAYPELLRIQEMIAGVGLYLPMEPADWLERWSHSQDPDPE